MNQNINERAKRLKRDYQKKWRQKNRQKILKYQEKYWLKKAEADYRKEVIENGENEDN